MSVHPWPPPAASSESLQWWIVCGNAGPQGTSAVLLGQFNRTAATQEQWAKRSALPAPALPGTEVSRAKEQSVAPRHSYHFHLEVRSQTQFSTGKEAWGMKTYKGSADRLITTWQHQVPISPTVHGSVLDQLSPAGATEAWRSRTDCQICKGAKSTWPSVRLAACNKQRTPTVQPVGLQTACHIYISLLIFSLEMPFTFFIFSLKSSPGVGLAFFLLWFQVFLQKAALKDEAIKVATSLSTSVLYLPTSSLSLSVNLLHFKKA